MKSTLRNLLLSLSGLAVAALALLLYSRLPELAGKFLLLIGCSMFGYGIATIIIEKKTPK